MQFSQDSKFQACLEAALLLASNACSLYCSQGTKWAVARLLLLLLLGFDAKPCRNRSKSQRLWVKDEPSGFSSLSVFFRLSIFRFAWVKKSAKFDLIHPKALSVSGSLGSCASVSSCICELCGILNVFTYSRARPRPPDPLHRVKKTRERALRTCSSKSA